MSALKKYRIFVVDDDVSIAELCALVLRGAGFEVEIFCDGLKAIKRAMECEPNLVLTDFSMPKLDGIKLATGCMTIFRPAM
jgi:CheY-like chemotaxis protein